MSHLYAPRDFLTRLANDDFHEPIVITGMVKHDADLPDSISFAPDETCHRWVSIPVDLIEHIEHLRNVRCKDHSHPYARLQLKSPPRDNIFGVLLAELLRTKVPGTPGVESLRTDDVFRCDRDTHPCCDEPYGARWGGCAPDAATGVFRQEHYDADCEPDGLTRPCTPIGTEISFNVSECIFGWTAAYRRTGHAIVVRIRLIPDATITSTQLDLLKTTWRDGIRNTWSNRFACSPGWPNLTFDVRWVSGGEHHLVTVKPGPGRSDMTTWHDDDDGNTAAHEFGHMLGYPDEYAEPSICPSRSPVNTGTVMDAVTGPATQGYIDGVCSASPLRTMGIPMGGSARMAISKSVRRQRIGADDLQGPARFTLAVSGGGPRKRLDYAITIDEADGKVTYRHLDQLKQVDIQPSSLPASEQAIAALKELLLQGELPVDDAIAGPFVPGTIIGKLTLEANGKQQVVYFPVEDSPGDNFGAIPDAAMREMKRSGTDNAIQAVNRILLNEANRVLNARR